MRGCKDKRGGRGGGEEGGGEGRGKKGLIILGLLLCSEKGTNMGGFSFWEGITFYLPIKKEGKEEEKFPFDDKQKEKEKKSGGGGGKCKCI